MDTTANTAALQAPRYILLTDIYQSSRLSEQYPQLYAQALDMHNAAVEQAVATCDGQIYKSLGDGFIALFQQAADCLACAMRLQQAFATIPAFSADDPFLVRVIAHGGVLRPAGQEYYGPALNRASRICQVCHPGQMILSDAVKPAASKLPPGAKLIDLGLHHLRDLAEPEHLYQLDHQAFSRREFPPLPTLKNRPNNLVEQPNAFIGRTRELEELREMLRNSRRLVTIAAPGGYGKSRLATQLCADLLASFQRGVFFIELAPLRDHTGIGAALASAIGFRFYGSRDPAEQLIDYLREKELLLCLDNFEHVLDGAALVSDILKAAPEVKAVVTSREPLRIAGEQVYPLEPLPVSSTRVPAGDLRDTCTEAGATPDAVLLFADRAAQACPSFTLDGSNLTSVQAICEQLGGIPLAVELAAAWTDSFTLSELRAELDQQLELTARKTDIPRRHQNLRACLDWSWHLLSPKQQRILMQLAAFRGGCFIDAAAVVLGTKGKALRRELATLADKSWLTARAVHDQTRFFLRDAASHEYAFEQLVATRNDGRTGFQPVDEDAKDDRQDACPTGQVQPSLYESTVMAHAQYFSALIWREGEKLHRHEQLEALQRISLEQQNIYEALDTLINRIGSVENGSTPVPGGGDISGSTPVPGGDSTSIDEKTGAIESLLFPFARWLWEYLDMTSAYRELVERYEGLKSVARQASSLKHTLLWALLGCSYGQWRLSNHDEASRDARKGQALAQARDDRDAFALSLMCLAHVTYGEGNIDGSRELYSQSLAAFREIGDQSSVAIVLSNLGLVEDGYGNLNAAHALHAESLAISRKIGDRDGIAMSLNNLGLVEYTHGHYDAARELHEESLATSREIGDQGGIAVSLNNLGLIDQSEGSFDAARTRYAEALALSRDIGDRSGIATYLHNLGLLEHSQDHFKAARDLYAKALVVSREINYGAGICALTAVCGQLLATASQAAAGAVCLYGSRYQAEQLGQEFDPIEGTFLEQGLSIIEHPDTGLPPAERQRLKVQAEALSADELAEYTQKALKKVVLGE